jgi:C1A family cysteine protease
MVKLFTMNIFNLVTRHFEPEVKPIERKFGWVRQLPDQRDFKFTVEAPIALPPLVDLRPQCPPIYDQGQLGSCTANALGAAYEFEKMKQKQPYFMPSRLFIYYNERVIENTVKSDSGAQIRDGIKTIASQGVCPETMWAYVESKFAVKPSCKCYSTAKKNEVKQYLAINHSLADIKQCLAQGYPVVFGFTVYESFMTDIVAKTGIMPMPNLNETPEGGHAIMSAGYDDSKEALIIRNSWGVEWGLKGYFYMPYSYITTPNLSSDFWTIRLVA